MREPLAWQLNPGRVSDVATVAGAIRRAARGPIDESWSPPGWLLPHQVDAAARLAGSLDLFGAGLLADAVGLGKTYVALALATRTRGAAAVVPASLTVQWTRVARAVHVPLHIISHEALSRGATLPPAPLVIVDEAHRFRNPATRRHRSLARGIGTAPVLLVTATPVVNRATDLLHLLRLVLPDDGLAILGVPSLQRALETGDFAAVEHAAHALMVARSTRIVAVRLPRIDDLHVVSHPTMQADRFALVLERLERLTFPNLGDREAKEILRLNLYARLASSTSAIRETLRRHLGYLDVASRAAERGETVSRGAARRVIRELGELQIELGLPLRETVGVPPDIGEITAERARVLDLLDHLRDTTCDPKADALATLLEDGGGRKTIVFTTAVPTARALARHLGWRRAAVVAGGHAAIATGSIGVERALALFAPRAQRAREPGPLEQVNTLLATDLVSEGLDLQDAEVVVHYDLPWTPLRLAQRVGRLARLGSRHRAVSVAWFAPPQEIEERLRLVDRIVRKANDQLHLPVSATSVTGRAVVFNRSLEARERLAANVRAAPATPCHAFTAGRASVAALEWHLGKRAGALPEVIVIPDGNSGPASPALLEAALRSPAANADSPSIDACVERLVGLARRRLAGSERGPQDPLCRRLRRRLLRRGLTASRRRAAREVVVLDRVLAALSLGVRYGGLCELEELAGAKTRELERWVQRWSPPETGPASVSLSALLIAVD